ncbi:MAG: PhnE/PtxC family ABC transporter permease, partial [Bacillota bacterium]
MYAANPRRGWTATGVLTAALVASVLVTGFNPLSWDLPSAGVFVASLFPPDWSILPTVLAKMGETVGIAFLGTVLAFVLAFPFSLLAARNLTPAWIGEPVRWLMAILRAIPEFIWALLFIAAIGLGNVSG